MFDWPEHTQTSPTAMFLSLIVVPEESWTVISSGAASLLASSCASVTRQRPSAPVRAVCF